MYIETHLAQLAEVKEAPELAEKLARRKQASSARLACQETLEPAPASAAIFRIPLL